MHNAAEPEICNIAEQENCNEAEPQTRIYAEPGTLYLCATPIGNLGDITERVLRTLESVDLIAAEDTRNTLRLLNHFGIKKPLTSYHEYNKYTKAEELITKLHRGASIAVVTDAGTPAISDPGEVIAAMCLEQGIRVTSLPGACALITALTMSGMPARRFCFEGFLPADKKERRYILAQLQREERTTILYEAPHHLRGTLQELYDNLGDRRITLCRELTKKFEEALPMTLASAIAYYGENEPRGEYVLVLAGADQAALEEEKRRNFEEMTLEEHMALYTDQGLSRKDAMKKVAADRGVSKRDIYRELME
ncbi:MAG: 16S rRNA (cytidine(1402)-2'-O)-methyltransferase [Lachnospiraceae bacterium]|nr:16S rRNA (cytidine(1402)-2'-O)-methyltransferase [Lachnospiraceae bacterium]